MDSCLDKLKTNRQIAFFKWKYCGNADGQTNVFDSKISFNLFFFKTKRGKYLRCSHKHNLNSIKKSNEVCTKWNNFFPLRVNGENVIRKAAVLFIIIMQVKQTPYFVCMF